MQSNSHHEDFGAKVDYHLWATGVPSSERNIEAPIRTPSALKVWEPLPQSWFDEYLLKGNSIEHTFKSQDNWHFKDVGQGAFTFEVKNAGGNLVIALTGWNHSDLRGYYIVLDDDNHESYVLKPSRLGNDTLKRQILQGGAVTGRRGYEKVGGVSYDSNFRLVHDRVQTFWVMYQRGTIIVGKGGAPGSGPIILYMTPEDNNPKTLGTDLYHYGFAKHGSRWSGGITVRNTQSYSYTQATYFPLPPNPLSAATKPNGNMVEGAGVLYRPDPQNVM